SVLLLRTEPRVGDGDGERAASRRAGDVHGGEPTVLPLQRDLADGAGLGATDVAVDRAKYRDHVRVPGAGGCGVAPGAHGAAVEPSTRHRDLLGSLGSHWQ